VSKLRTPIFIALVLVISLAVTDAVLAPAPAPAQRDFIDTVLASRAVVVAIRVAIVFAALFVVLSVVALIARRQWLTRVGPVGVSERVFSARDSRQQLIDSVQDAQKRIETLKRELAKTDRVLDDEQR
jgi:uncharacterized protein YlxW (UPF0749 family)